MSSKFYDIANIGNSPPSPPPPQTSIETFIFPCKTFAFASLPLSRLPPLVPLTHRRDDRCCYEFRVSRPFAAFVRLSRIFENS